MLLYAKAPVDCLNKHGETPLALAALHGLATTVHILLEYSAAIDCCTENETRAIHLANLSFNSSTIELVVDAMKKRTTEEFACIGGVLV